MLENLLRRIEDSVTENEGFIHYFNVQIKMWTDHADSLEKSVKKFLDPIVIEHERQGSNFTKFAKKVNTMDYGYCQQQRNFAKKVQ